MKVQHIFAIAIMATAIVVMPAEAQTRKDKKAAKKEQWEMEQAIKKQQLQNQLDNQRFAQKLPCMEYAVPDNNDVFRGTAHSESVKQAMAKRKARMEAIHELGMSIGSAVKALSDDYIRDADTKHGENVGELLQERIINKVEAQLGFRIVCEEYDTHYKDNEMIWTCHLAIEISKDTLLKGIYDDLQATEEFKLEYDYERFKAEFDKYFE